MYNLEAVRRLLLKKGVNETLQILGNPDLPDNIKNALSKEHIFVGNFPNVELILSLI